MCSTRVPFERTAARLRAPPPCHQTTAHRTSRAPAFARPESQVSRPHARRSQLAPSFLRSERSGMIDSRSNAPGFALRRPRDASPQRPCGARPAMSPLHPPSPCSCQRPPRQCTSLYAQERAPGSPGALGRVLGRPPGAAVAACWPILADFVVGATPHSMHSGPAAVRSDRFYSDSKCPRVCSVRASDVPNCWLHVGMRSLAGP